VTIALTAPAAGTHKLTASYSGDTNFNVNLKSSSVTLTVTKTTPAFRISANLATLSMQQGATGTATLALTANESFSGPVTLAPSQTSTVNVSVATQLVAANHVQPRPQHGSTTGVVLAGVLLFGVLGMRRRRPALLLPSVLSFAVLSITGCSGSGSGSTTKEAAAGTYAVTIVAPPGDTTVASQAIVVALTIHLSQR
jgi:hypothetical protein